MEIMRITRTSTLTGITHTKDLPVTQLELDHHAQGELAQNVWGHLDKYDREFLISGNTKEEWESAFLSTPQKLNFTITKHNFLDFYFNSGADDDQEALALEIGQTVIENALKGNYDYQVDVQELFDNCGYISMMFCEEVDESHPFYELEDTDLREQGIDVTITLIDGVVLKPLEVSFLGVEVQFRNKWKIVPLMRAMNIGAITLEKGGRGFVLDPTDTEFNHPDCGGTVAVCQIDYLEDTSVAPDCKFDITEGDLMSRKFDRAEIFLEFEDSAEEDYASDVWGITLYYKMGTCTYAVDLSPETFTLIE